MTINYCDLCGRAHSTGVPVETDAVKMGYRLIDACTACKKRLEQIFLNHGWKADA